MSETNLDDKHRICWQRPPSFDRFSGTPPGVGSSTDRLVGQHQSSYVKDQSVIDKKTSKWKRTRLDCIRHICESVKVGKSSKCVDIGFVMLSQIVSDDGLTHAFGLNRSQYHTKKMRRWSKTVKRNRATSSGVPPFSKYPVSMRYFIPAFPSVLIFFKPWSSMPWTESRWANAVKWSKNAKPAGLMAFQQFRGPSSPPQSLTQPAGVEWQKESG